MALMLSLGLPAAITWSGLRSRRGRRCLCGRERLRGSRRGVLRLRVLRRGFRRSRGAVLGFFRCAAVGRDIIGLLARAPVDDLFAIAEREFQLCVWVLVFETDSLIDRPAGIWIVIQLGRSRAFRGTPIGVLGEVAWQRREAHRKIITVAEADADRSIRLSAVGRARRPGAAAARFFVFPHAVAAPACHIDVIGAAIVARKFADDVVLIGMAGRTKDVLTARVEIGQAPL